MNMIFGEDGSQEFSNQPNQPQQVRLETSGMETLYANTFALTGSADELTVYVGTNAPLPGAKQPVIRISHRLMMLPQNAKRLMIALQQAVNAHEERFGPIELPPNQNPGKSGR